jgi:ubiquinol-cytochrome c reductase cytochrome b subunit
VVAIGTVALTLLYWRSLTGLWRLIVGVGTLVLLFGYFAIDAKFWGVVLMGLSVLIFCAMPWLDRSPVKSIRYRGPLTRMALAVFVISFLVLGYLGTLTPTVALTRAAQFFTVLYFAYFLLMPLYSAIDSTKPVPERVTH